GGAGAAPAALRLRGRPAAAPPRRGRDSPRAPPRAEEAVTLFRDRIPHMSSPDHQRLRRRVRRLLDPLARLYPDGRCALDHATPLHLLVATILSAQCTDKRVNLVTPALFARYPDAVAFANADPRELERLIQSTGFFRSKARNIIACCQEIVAKHGGEGPATMEGVGALPGGGRKTANGGRRHALGGPGLPGGPPGSPPRPRPGPAPEADPVKIERDLMAVVPRQDWTLFGHRVIFHGRRVCHARKPLCGQCALARLCPKVGVGPAKR